ncbi:porin family protein, partial [Ferruginibacter sp. HRS2-29]
MIKLKLLFSLLAMTTFSSFAQRNPLSSDRENFFRFGAKGGVNINKIDGQSYKDGFNFNYQIGGFLQFNLTNKIGIQPEVSFVQSTSEFSSGADNVYDDLFLGGGQRKAKLNYLEVPVFLNVNLGPSKRVKLQVGPAFNGLLKQTVDSLKTNADIFKKAEWSAIGGLWVQLPLINLGARY